MKKLSSTSATCLLYNIILLSYSNALNYDAFINDGAELPEGLLIGAATSAFQVEGAWNISDKGESTWDWFVHNVPNAIKDNSTGDIACNSYFKYKEDIGILKSLGVDYYRFSISWARVLPTGYAHVISKDGVKYYHDILDELERNNIQPFVTLYHWDHPQVLDKIGGWTNKFMVELFANYAKFIFQEYGQRIKQFLTINEPHIFCQLGYELNEFAPGLNLGKAGLYRCGHNMLKAHARAYHIYDKKFRPKYRGKIGIAIDCEHYYSKNPTDTVSNDIAYEFVCGWIANPIFSRSGDYPKIMKLRIGANSRYEGLAHSRLPKFSKKWIKLIRGSSDYFGLNHYTSRLVEPAPPTNNTIYEDDVGLIYSYHPSWTDTSCSWKAIQNISSQYSDAWSCIQNDWAMVAAGFGDLLRKIKTKYSNPPVYVMENGIADAGGLKDDLRYTYLSSYMKEMITAMTRDGCNVKAYTIWSLLDNFEWNQGYTYKFGLIQVDFSHPNRTRTFKSSATWIQNVLRKRKLSPKLYL